jgi:hypothetical protein
MQQEKMSSDYAKYADVYYCFKYHGRSSPDVERRGDVEPISG